jgi:hypothetical protein
MNSYNLYVKEEMLKLKENTKLTGQERMRIIRENWQKKKREEKNGKIPRKFLSFIPFQFLYNK